MKNKSKKVLFTIRKPGKSLENKRAPFKLHDYTDFDDLDEKKCLQDGPIEVHTRIIFSRMGIISTVDEKFDCHAFVECCWDDDKLYEIILREADLVNNTGIQLRNRLNQYLDEFIFDPCIHWTPKTYFENGLGEVKTEKTYKIQVINKLNPNSIEPYPVAHMMTIRVFEQKFIRGAFYEKLELHEFPMDTQELSITVSSHLSEKEVKFVENTNDPSSISTEVFLNEQEWRIFGYVIVRERTLHDTFKGFNRSGISVSAYVTRKAGYFFNNAYSIIFLITVLGFVPFSVSSSNPSGRMSVAGVLILTQVNFRWLITQRIPPVSYLTAIDKYAIGNLFIQILFAMWHAIIGSGLFDSISDYRSTYDSYALYALTGIFMIYTLFTATKCIYTQKQINKWEMDKNSLS